ncbi:hypothetical protein ACVIGA_002266 [Bradyrhizobium sp. USDA 3240]
MAGGPSDELSLRNLTRVQIKECAPQWDLIIAQIEKCAAIGDTECHISQQESDEINQAPDGSEEAKAPSCKGILIRPEVQGFAATAFAEAKRNVGRTYTNEKTAAFINDFVNFIRDFANFDPRYSTANGHKTADEIKDVVEKLTAAEFEVCFPQVVKFARDLKKQQEAEGPSLEDQTRRCFGAPGHYSADTKTDSYENAIAAFGQEKFYALIFSSMKVYSPCPLIELDPEGWPESRLAPVTAGAWKSGQAMSPGFGDPHLIAVAGNDHTKRPCKLVRTQARATERCIASDEPARRGAILHQAGTSEILIDIAVLGTANLPEARFFTAMKRRALTSN